MTGAAPDIDLDSAALDELNNQEAKALLDTIDNLRALDVGEIVHLPQIIVVGDQSSGKSSVLEAISHVRFPVKGDVCTRFATELVLRKAPEFNVDVSIRFSGSGPEDRSSEPFRKAGFGRDDLPRLVDEATGKMGVRAGTTNDFSKDVLRVEVTGPDVPSLTLVDLPGFFHSATADQSLQGKNTVDELVQGYMKQNNSIILAVVAANAQLAGQIVLDKCLENDPTRARTMGVITKPDLAPAGSDMERKYLQLAQNKESHHKLALGWHVLRNDSGNERCASDDPAKERDERETRFLSSGSWAELVRGNKGIASLRRKLGKVLLDHIRETLPGVIDEIRSSLDGRVTKLNQLGKARATIQDMKTYLINIAEDFQRLVRDGANGIYSDGFFGKLGDTDRKLRANLRNLNRAFEITLLTKGASRKIQPSNDESNEDGDRGDARTMDPDIPDYLRPFVSCYDFDHPEEVSESDVCRELECWAAANQGKELPGMPNKDLVIQLFQAQAQPWRAISQRHVDLVTDVVKEFMEHLVAHVVGEGKATALAILRNCIDPFFDERSRNLAAKLEELLAPYEKGYGIPLGGEYQSLLSRMSLTRLASRVSGIVLDELSDADRLTPKKISDAIVSSDELRRGDFGTEIIVDMMKAYYEMSRRTFAETVVNLAVESCLVCHVDGILTPSKVNAMEDDEVRELASESPEVTYERELLESQVAKLRDGLKICRRHRPRGTQALSSTLSASRAGSRRPSPTPPSSSGTKSTSTVPQVKVSADAKPPGSAASWGAPKGDSMFPKPQAPTSVLKSNGPFFFKKSPEGNQASAPAPSNSPSPFQQPLLRFGSPSSGGFGSSGTSVLEGSSTSMSSQPASRSGGLFGGSSTSTSTQPAFQSGGLFGGSSTSTSTQPASQSGGIFGVSSTRRG